MLMVGRPNAAFAGQAEVGTVRVYERVSDPVEDCTLGGDASNVPAYTPCHFPFVYTRPYTTRWRGHWYTTLTGAECGRHGPCHERRKHRHSRKASVEWRFSDTMGAEIGAETTGGHHGQHGAALALNSDGTVLAIGAPYNDGVTAADGHTRVYLHRRAMATDGRRRPRRRGAERPGGLVGGTSSDGTILAVGADQLVPGGWR